FFNFFERLRGQGFLTWRAVRYEDCREEDLAACDLAVFSRPRYPEVPALLDRCRDLGRPVLAMIDDNWIAAGRELPQAAAIFTPGQPPFEVFREAMRRANAVLVFSAPLEEDVRPLAARVLRLPPNIDLERFTAPAAPRQPPRQPGLLVGFAGSPRLEPAGFRGLARFLARRPAARLLVMAHQVPPELAGVAAERVLFVPWRHGYDGYARTLAGLRPDVLVAPLGASRFEASKIPTKFLEAAAVGAAGVYSRVAPYSGAVRDGETGLLADNDEEAWAAALERLAGDPGLRRRLAASALAEVRERFETGRVLPAFLAALREVLAA
ncbi:MAG TPA: glycosyltransferase, partial [Thermoanaerobaculia bacterium]|nr:glycosyltransferase [Thermoanaerobaculia bacterium]